MAEILKVPALEKPAEPVSRWIARVMMAVILAEGIWGLLVSLIRDLAVPFLAKQMGGDPQSPLYLGKGDYNFPGLFVSVLELCLAGIVAVALNAWACRGTRSPKVKTVTVRKVSAPTPTKNSSIASGEITTTAAPPVVAPPAAASSVTPAFAAAAPVSSPVQATAPPRPVTTQAKPAPPPPPPKPAKPKEVYYNIVGEPINPTEDD